MEQSRRRFTEGSSMSAHQKEEQKVNNASSLHGHSPALSYMTKPNGMERSRSTGAIPRGTMEQSTYIGQHFTATGIHCPQSIANDMDTLLALPLTPFKLKLIHRRLNTVVSLITKFESRAREGARLEREVIALRKRLDAETARRQQMEKGNERLQEQLDDLARALSERVSNLEQYEEAAHMALQTRKSLTHELEEKHQALLDQENKLRSSVRLAGQLEKEQQKLQEEEGIVDVEAGAPKFDKRKRTSVAIRLREENQRRERISLLEQESCDNNEPLNDGAGAHGLSDGANELQQRTVMSSALPIPASVLPLGSTSLPSTVSVTIQSGVYQFLPYKLA